MNTTEDLLVNLIRMALWPKPAEFPKNLTNEQIAAVYKESLVQSVPVLAFEALPETARNELPDFKMAVLKTVKNNIAVTYEHAAIGKTLDEQNIPYCILKGYASADYYHNPESRAMGDTDFLIAKKDVERAAAVLKQLGYIPNKNADAHDFHYEFHKGKLIAEMHYSISSKTEFGFDPATLTNNILLNARNCKTPYGSLKIPSAYHHAVIMLLHLYRHYRGVGIGLRHLCDWAVFVNSKDYDSIVNELFTFTNEWQLTRFCQMLSQVSAFYLGIEYKKSFGKPNKQLCSELMDDILRTGNFGRKINSSLKNLFVNKELDAKGKSRITAFLISVKEVVCSHWPRAKHNILILMAGTVVFSAKYLFRLLAGKRTKLHLISDYKEAKKQVELRRKLTDKE